MPEFTARRSIKDMFSKQTVSSTPAGGAEVGVGGSQSPIEGEVTGTGHDAMVSVNQTANRATGGSSPPTTNSSSVEDLSSANAATRGESNSDGGVSSQNSAKRNASPMGVAPGVGKRKKASVAAPKSTTGQQKQSRLLGFFKPRDGGSQKDPKITSKTNSAKSLPAKKMGQRVEGNEAQGGDSDDGGASVGADTDGHPPTELARESHPCSA